MARIFEWFGDNPWATAVLMVLFIGVSTLMVLAILIQRPGGGLSAAFGGSSGGSGQTHSAPKQVTPLTWFTISVFATFILFGIVLEHATAPAPGRGARPTPVSPVIPPLRPSPRMRKRRPISPARLLPHPNLYPHLQSGHPGTGPASTDRPQMSRRQARRRFSRCRAAPATSPARSNPQPPPLPPLPPAPAPKAQNWWAGRGSGDND